MNKFAKKPWLFSSILLIGVLAISSAFNKNQKSIWGQNLLDSLTDSQKRETQKNREIREITGKTNQRNRTNPRTSKKSNK